MKGKRRCIRKPLCLSVWVSPLITLNQLVGFHGLQLRGHSIEGDFDVIVLIIASSILIWRRFKLLSWLQNIHQSALDYQGLSLVSTVGHAGIHFCEICVFRWNLFSRNSGTRGCKFFAQQWNLKTLKWFGIILVHDWPKMQELPRIT
jgi:hypothetical protein